jgi:hypothetical protein
MSFEPAKHEEGAREGKVRMFSRISGACNAEKF